ncbi:hypothetical protein AX17_000628 [Amanita inopinata Kibby_2008]|nr:hypothetical protein AX17_000628 [Amanita inopinata Kibby_2008]
MNSAWIPLITVELLISSLGLAMHSNVGNQRVYDQRLPKTTGPQKSRLERRDEHGTGPAKSYINIENKDERSIMNELAAARKDVNPEENTQTITVPLAPVAIHEEK